MCFDICAINIRVSIRVRGLHLVFVGKAGHNWMFEQQRCRVGSWRWELRCEAHHPPKQSILLTVMKTIGIQSIPVPSPFQRLSNQGINQGYVSYGQSIFLTWRLWFYKEPGVFAQCDGLTCTPQCNLSWFWIVQMDWKLKDGITPQVNFFQ